MGPKFFKFSYSHWTRGYPWGSLDYRDAKKIIEICPECGGERSPRYEGEFFVDIDETGTKWPDILGTDGAKFLFSERVVGTLRDEGIQKFAAHPAIIRNIKSRKLRNVRPPKYYYINIYGQMDVDLQASGVRVLKKGCPVCLGGRKTEGEYIRYVPLVETWDGSDIFELRNATGRCCTDKVLLLARKHRWTNFSFEPLDVIREYSLGWPGIDYLGKKWPPAKWYPDPPSAGKTVDEWLSMFASDNSDAQWKARKALLDLKEEAVPGLVRLMKSGSGDVKERAREMLSLLSESNVKIPDDILRQVYAEERAIVEKIMASDDDSAFSELSNLLHNGTRLMRRLAAEALLSMKEGRFARYAQAIEGMKRKIDFELKDDG